MISWLPKKTINHKSLRKLLKASQDANQFSNGGPAVNALQNQLHNLLKLSEEKSVVVTANGTVAIQAIIGQISSKLGRRIKVTTQSFTFPSSAMMYSYDAHVIDVNDSGGPDILTVPDDTDVLVVTNVFGRCVDLKQYENFCKERNIFLLLDNAATALTYVEGRNICEFGDASIVSLHHTKPLGFGEGGAIICHKDMKNDIENSISFGMLHDRSKFCRYAMNARMSDVSAACISQYLQNNFSKIINLHNIQKETITKIEELGFRIYPSIETTTQIHSCIPVLAGNEFLNRFLSLNVEAKKYYNPISNLTPKASSFFEEIVCLPTHVDMKEEDYELYIKVLRR